MQDQHAPVAGRGYPAVREEIIDSGLIADPRLSVLVVEDSPPDSRLLLEGLRAAVEDGSIIVAVVRRLADAVSELGRRHFDCALVDLGLPDGRGIGNVEAICRADAGTAVIVLTALDSDTSALQSQQLGAQDYVVKGQYDPTLLVKRVRLAVQRHRQVRALEARNRSDFERATLDPLTGLANRKLFDDRAGQVLAQARRDASEFAICFIDLDGFKAANDLHGHSFGDEVLRAVGSALGRSARGSDTVARIGGDEFAVLLVPGSAFFDPLKTAQRYRDSLLAIQDIAGQSIKVGCSIGIACFPGHGITIEDLVRNSDSAMYQIKRRGGGVLQYSGDAAEVPPKKSPVTVPVAAPAPAATALPIVLAYQPWVDSAVGRCVGVEVLAQWMEGDSIVPAETFLPEAERSGLIRDIGREVMRQAFRQWAKLHDAGLDPGCLALNVSTAELLDEGYVHALLSAALAARVEPFKLRVEVRSDSITDQRAARTLRRLREAGCSVILDRFGEDSIDLTTLTEQQVDGIKLDRRLLRRLASEGLSGTGRRVVTATLGAAAALNLPVIVTGVESEEDVRLLSFTDTRYQQGLWHSRCVSADELLEQLRACRTPLFAPLAAARQ
jgi:diguanylate cyclase (GGDEF)-like protein